MLNLNTHVALEANDITIFNSPKQYKQQLLELINTATNRIYITALYLQDDAAGREILNAIYQKKKSTPDLKVKIFVDSHRAQRGLIGEKEQLGNRALYLKMEQQHECSIDIFGVAVKRKEVFGVLHLKGMVFDDTLFYTGASINDVYLHQEDKYRLDRYYQFDNASLADSFCHYLDQVFVHSGLAPSLNKGEFPGPQDLKKLIHQLKNYLGKSQYKINGKKNNGDIEVTPLVGFGRRRNKLNSEIRRVVRKANNELTIFTPYFNFPKVLTRDLAKALKRGVKVSITVGDKTANDFYISDQDKFSTIGGIPYIYEMILVTFVKKWKKYIDRGQLTIRLWKDGANSYHLKGLIADDRYHLITGSNINPRAWSLDLENGLLIDDKNGHLSEAVQQELDLIYQHTFVIKDVNQIETLKDYPPKPQKLLKRLKLSQVDHFLKRLL